MKDNDDRTTDSSDDDVDAAGLTADTFSQSSNDDDDDDNDEEFDDENDDNDEDLPFWRQHWLAIVIAFLAAIAGHLFQLSQPGISAGSEYDDHYYSLTKHGYVDGFHRTANISFCQTLTQQENDSPSSSKLKPMDFYISQDLLDVLTAYYQADDSKEDDDMFDNLYHNNDNLPLPITNPDFECLIGQQQNNAANQKFKGLTYYWKDRTLEEIYPDIGNERGTDVVIFSRQRKLQQPPLDYTGFAAKFINLSPKPVLLYWDGKGGREDANKLVGEIAPFESLGTATMPGHSFHVTPNYDSSSPLQRWVVTADTALVYYEPKSPTEMKESLLPAEDPMAYSKYQRQLVNQAFARDYLIASKRQWLSNFPRRFPIHYMYPAEYIGQQFEVGRFKLRVASVAPRVLLIDDFLTPQECQDVIQLSKQEGLQLSTLHSGATVKQTRDLSTRSSSNTWLSRDTNDLTEKIYRQAAEVMKIDPELFQKFHETSAHHHSIAESLQVVRYKAGGEEYQPHHDFVYPSIDHRYQPTRFATLLVYLNDVEDGGETRFPRAVNNYNSQGLEIQPKVGQAALFYNMLEDGNVDDLSVHGSNPTTKHEKWLTNLWVWDPVID